MMSDIKQKVHDISIFNYIIFTFGAHFAGFFSTLFTFVLNEIVKRDGLCTNKATLEVAMDNSSGLRRSIALVNGLGAHFLDACSEVGLQTQ